MLLIIFNQAGPSGPIPPSVIPAITYLTVANRNPNVSADFVSAESINVPMKNLVPIDVNYE